jgi:peptide/nickel transport system substrate-binding protein
MATLALTRRSLSALLAAGTLGWAGRAEAASAATLVIGRASEQSSLDPLFSRTGNNGDTSVDMFDQLIASDGNNQIMPALALSWHDVDPTTWEIKLRPGVTFHDGSPFTADDVIFSVDRARNIPNSPAPYSSAVRGISGMQAVDPLTLRVTTATPTPQLIEQLGEVYIMSRKAASGVSTADLNGGKGLVGTGPYKFVSYQPAQSLVMVKNPSYWGDKPAWDKVTLRFIPQDASRVAALLSGDVDMIDEVPPTDVARVKSGDRTQLFTIASTRLVYLALDSARQVSPLVTDANGKPMDKNPLQDPRVRAAISKMIDRQAICSRLLDDSATPAGQIVPEGLGGYDSTLPPPKVDLAGAKQLLTEAGWPHGFGLTISSSSDRLPQDSEVAQALGQMLRRGGLRINGVATMPYSVYAAQASKQAFSAFVFSIGTVTSNAALALTAVLETYNPKAGTGAFNRARYSNPQFDAVMTQALGEFDPTKRNELLRQATHIAFTDTAIVPLYWQIDAWATKKGIAYTPRRDETTAARYVRPAA